MRRRALASPLLAGIGQRLAVAGLAAGVLWLLFFWAIS
jgi:mannose/fructose/N-acetylgalactosamine-specific phosphotransferase system component IID